MIVSYPPFYPQQILDADGKPVAGGRILSFYAGTDVPLAMFAPDGTSLGSSVSIASDGTAVFCLKVGTPYKLVCVDVDGATIWTRDKVKVSAGDGMVNPMDAKNQMIVGGVDGDPTTIAPTSRNQVVTFDGDDVVFAAPKVPAAPGDTRYKDSVHEAIDPVAPLKKGVRVATGGRAWTTLEIAPSTTTDDVLCTEEIDGEKAVTWGRRMKNPMLAQADMIVGGADGAATRLPAQTDGVVRFLKSYVVGGIGAVIQWARLKAGSGISFSEHGEYTEINSDGTILTSGTDTTRGYLADKLVPGANVSITPVTDPDTGEETLELTATGGGGGGGAPAIIEPFKIANCTGTANDAGCAVMQFAPYKFTPTALTYYVNAYTGSTRKIKGVVYNSSGKVVYSSAELPLVNKMNTIPLSKVTTYEDKAYFTPGELFFIGVAISSGDSSYQWWTMSSSWYKSFVMSYPPPDTKSNTNQNTIHWMSLTVTPLS